MAKDAHNKAAEHHETRTADAGVVAVHLLNVAPSVNLEIHQDVGIGEASQALMASLKQEVKG
jgi:hypothetical protein